MDTPGGHRKMAAYRLSNTSHTEIAQSLPLPNLPISFGANTPELRFFENVQRGQLVHEPESYNKNDTSNASRIAELLSNTDVSYLSLREEPIDAQVPTNPKSLVGAVLQFNSEAFSFSPSRIPARQHHSQAVEKKMLAAPITFSSNIGKQELLDGAEEGFTPKRARTKRKRRQEADIQPNHPPTLEETRDAAINGVCELLNELFEKTDAEDDQEGAFLCLGEIKCMGEELASVHIKGLLGSVPVHHIVRLLGLLDRHVQRAHEMDIDEDDDAKNEIIMTALEAIQIALSIMATSGMPKQVYKEEIIDRIIEFTRYQIVHSVFTAYDPFYRQLHKNTEAGAEEEGDEDRLDEGNEKNRRKGRTAKAKKLTTKVSTAVYNALLKLCSILASLKDLLSVERLLDSTLLQLMKTVLGTFGVENVQLLQLKAIGVACTVFELYPQHRTIILDEVLSMLWKLPCSKRNLRTFHLPDEESKQIQMVTALLLHLVQCSVSLPQYSGNEPQNESQTCNNGAEAPKCYETAVDASMYFWKPVVHRWVTPKSQDGVDVKAIVENLVADLLTTLNMPEFPAASLLLQVFCALILNPLGVTIKDAAVLGMAIDLLGQIAAHLKQDAVRYNKDDLWILRELFNQAHAEVNITKDVCVVCGHGKSVKFMLRCDGCRRWFHGDCIGVSGNDPLNRGWLCYCCVCRKQLVFFCSDIEVGRSQKAHSEGALTSISSSDSDFIKDGEVVAQQMLLNFLLESTDSFAVFARRFYLCLWYRYDPLGLDHLHFYHKRWNAKSHMHDFGIAPVAVSRDIVVRICRALSQSRSLARGFDRILEKLLVTLQDKSPIPRAKALRAVSAIVEVDPAVLGDQRVQLAVEGRFLDSAISVREAAMELVGRHIVSCPDVALKYFDRIAERIMDTGVSVRKRVIKIIRDICVSNCGFSKTTEACICIISRINDEEVSIQDLVFKTFYEMWFDEPSSQNAEIIEGESSVPVGIAERAQQLVDVLQSLTNSQPLVMIIKRSLALDFNLQPSRNNSTMMLSHAAVRNRCELICRCLLENILKVEETSEDSEAQATPYVLALQAFCMVDPTLCAPGSDRSRFATTLQPYLKSQVDNRDVAQLLQSIVFVIDAVLPLLRRPLQSFIEELDRDLRQLIVRYSFLTVVHACIKCLSSLSKVSLKGVNSFEFLVRQFFKILDSWSKEQSSQEKANVLRSLFCLGLLIRYGVDIIEAMDDQEITMDHILKLYKHYLQSKDIDIAVRALQALGCVFLARPILMMENDIGQFLMKSLSPESDPRAKVQVLRNFHDYLLDVEKQMGEDEDHKQDGRKKEQAKGVPVAAGAGDSNICGGIIQLHWESILDCCLDVHDQVRQASLKVVEIVLRQGLVHPMTCVPHLIALEVDQLELNAKLAHRLLVHMNEKYPSFLESRLGDGLLLSYSFIISGAAIGKTKPSTQVQDGASAAFAKPGISRIYRLIRGNRSSRNKFLSSVTRKFDWIASARSSISFLVYCSEVLAALPFTCPDEPLYLLYAINRIIQIRGGDLEANIKAAIYEGPLANVAQEILKTKGNGEKKIVNLNEELPHLANLTDGDNETFQKAFLKLKVDCEAAVGLGLLLSLKRHLKCLYCLNDARCQAYSPTEQIKSGESLSKQNIKEFNCSGLPISQAHTIDDMLEQYQVLKRLLKEEAMDYSSYATTPTAPKRRSRANLTPTSECKSNGHTKVLRKKSRASTGIVSDDDEADDDDDDYAEPNSTVKRKRRESAAKPRKLPLFLQEDTSLKMQR